MSTGVTADPDRPGQPARHGAAAGPRRLGWGALVLAGVLVGVVGLVLPLVAVRYPAHSSVALHVLPWAPLVDCLAIIAAAVLATTGRGLAGRAGAVGAVAAAAVVVASNLWVLARIRHERGLFQLAPQSKDDPYPITIFTFAPGAGWWLLLAAALIIGGAGLAALADLRRAGRPGEGTGRAGSATGTAATGARHA